MATRSEEILEQGGGILRLAPTWVPRTFCIPGKRIRLHPADLYAFGAHRGGIDERWFASTAKADNGPETLPDEGLSYVVSGNGKLPERILFKDVVDELGSKLLGEDLWNQYHGWPVFAKFFDNQGPLPFHLHQLQEHANMVNARTKPEAYFFPPQLNNHRGDFPYTFFGFEPGTTKDQVRHCLEIWDEGDNGILDLSKAYHLQIGTGWDIPAGILHAPGSLCTFEPQWASDIYAMFQSLVNDIPLDREMLVKYVPEDKKNDLDFIVSMIDWEANTNLYFKKDHFLLPKPIRAIEAMQEEGYIEKWVTYKSPLFATKELTVLPGRTVEIQDPGPYGMILLEGHGTMGNWAIESPTIIRFGQLTNDEFFVSAQASQEGVTIQNSSEMDPLVILKYFGPGIKYELD